SASRKASSNCLRKSPAITRSFAVVRPKLRKTLGKSFGPTTTISTIAMTRISDQPKSNIVQHSERRRRHLRLACLLLGITLLLVGAMLDRLGLVGIVGHSLAEVLYALGHVAHQLRNLAPAEQEQHHHEHN